MNVYLEMVLKDVEGTLKSPTKFLSSGVEKL
jgi:hypothetical protein